jgi:outer membrane protein assembly factor BamB
MPMDGRRDGIATVQNVGGQVIVQSAFGRVACLDGATGAVRWIAAVGVPYQVTFDVAYNDELIIVSNATRVYGLDRVTGAERWMIDLPTTPSSPPVADNIAIYINLSNGRLASYLVPDAPKYITLIPVTRTGEIDTAAAAKANTLPSNDPRAAAFAGAPSTGSGRTVTVSTALDNRSATIAVKTIGGRTVAGGIDVKKAYSALQSTHAPYLLWDLHTAQRVYQRPVLGKDSVMVVSSQGTAFFANRGGIDRSELPTDSRISAPIGQYAEYAYVADRNGVITAIDLDRRSRIWQYTANGPVTTMPQATDGDLFVVSDRGGLIRLDRATGTQVWQNPEATEFLAANPKFVYGLDRVGNLLVIDHKLGTTISKMNVRDFVVHVQNETTDRVLLAANDGTLVCLNDKSYPMPLTLQNEGTKATTPTPADAKPATKPEPRLPGTTPPATPPSGR